MKAAIYCRVSTEDQEREGTSLQTQAEACLKYCLDKGYTVTHQYSETYTGLSLDRPNLGDLRELIRNGDIDVIVVFCLDRLSRDPTHGVLIFQELEKCHVTIEAVTEDIDTSELGKLITYIRGFASKLEAEKIRERTMRGKRARALSGKIPGGGGRKFYGYDYIKGKESGQGIRKINDFEAQWVREVFHWLVDEGLSVNGITMRLRSLGVPTPAGSKYWRRQTVFRMLSNPAYIGKTYAFTKEYVEPKRRMSEDSKRRKTRAIIRPKEEWIEVPNATPPIIDDYTFETAQAVLKRNKELATRNAKRQYLLSGYIFCQKCGRRYQGYVKKWRDNGKLSEQRYYRCGGSQAIVTPEKCTNSQYNAPLLEKAVWGEIEKALADPDTVLVGLESMRDSSRIDHLEKELETVNMQLKNRQKQKDRIHKAFHYTGDEDKFKHDIAEYNGELSRLQERQTTLQQSIQNIRDAEANYQGIKKACELVRNNLESLDYENKRFALEALKVRVTLAPDEAPLLTGLLPCKFVKPSSKHQWHSRYCACWY